MKRYGEGWVAITGGSDGIGFGLAQQFGKRGFNLFLIARTESKLIEAKQELSKTYGVEVRYLVADFGESEKDPISFFDKITSVLDTLPLAVLVNNVGKGGRLPLDQQEEANVLFQHALNLWPVAYLSHYFINRLEKENRRGGLINIQSVAGSFPAQFTPVYSADKAFGDYLSRALSTLYRGKVDVLSVRPGYVSTQLVGHMPVGGTVWSAETCAEAAVKSLGKAAYTYGWLVHSFVGMAVYFLPRWVTAPLFATKVKIV